MKIRRCLIVMILGLFFITGSSSCGIWYDEPSGPAAYKSTTQIAGHPDQLKFPPLKLTIPKPKRVVLDNELIVYLLEDHELPLLNIVVRVKGGSVYDPTDKLGLANLTATLMRNGGAGRLSAEQFDEELESMGAELKVEADYEEINFNMSILKEDAERGLQLLADMLRTPQFAEGNLTFEKQQLAEVFRRQNDRPGEIAGRELRKAIYRDHPYANEPRGTAETVASITREDILKFHKQYIIPNNIFLGLAGDFSSAALLKLIRDKLGDWSKRRLVVADRPPLGLKYEKSVYLAAKEINQTSIMLGHLAPKRTTPDYFPLLLMNAILGSSSSARLDHKVREEKGLAYGIFSYFVLTHDLGMFIVETDTKNESVGEATRLILEEINKIRTEPVKDEELRHTKDAILSGFVFRFANPIRIIDQYIYIEYLGLEPDYLETYRDNVMKVTKDDILRVAKQYLRPDDFVFMFVGNEPEIKPQVLEFGPINTIRLE